MTAPVIMIGTPCYGNMMSKGYVMSIMQGMMACMQAGYQLTFNFLGNESLIPRGRTRITADFLDKSGATHLFFIDADISFTPDQMLKLIKADKDIAAGIYPVKNIFWDKIARRTADGEPPHEAGLIYTARACKGADLKTDGDFATADYAATGFMLIKRGVFEKMIAAYPETKFSYLDVPEPGHKPRDTLYALYDCAFDPATGHYMSEDYAFCKRWRDIGGEIWIDLKSRLTHEGAFQFHGNAESRYGDLLGRE
ncbi:MAG: hypothetical protein KDE14_04360 [Rhodobacteraceae bacterium]|nr:hypothetical protein [Paracoccaceae bacterium]